MVINKQKKFISMKLHSYLKYGNLVNKCLAICKVFLGVDFI